MMLTMTVCRKLYSRLLGERWQFGHRRRSRTLPDKTPSIKNFTNCSSGLSPRRWAMRHARRRRLQPTLTSVAPGRCLATRRCGCGRTQSSRQTANGEGRCSDVWEEANSEKADSLLTADCPPPTVFRVLSSVFCPCFANDLQKNRVVDYLCGLPRRCRSLDRGTYASVAR